MLVNYVKQPLTSLRKPKKERKQKGSRIFARLGAKPKKSVTKSEKQKFLQQILRSTKDIMTPTMENINQILTDEKVDASLAEKNFFLAAAKSQVDIKSLSIARNLISKPFTYYILSPFISQDFLTNDYLYISFLASSVANEEKNVAYLKYKNVYVATQNALILNSNQKFKEYYYQDFSPECSSPDWFYTKPVNSYDVISSRREVFFIDNVKYFRDILKPLEEDKTATVITQDKFSVEKAVEKLNKLEKIYDKTELTKGVKTLEKNSGAYYVQMSLKPTSFCPSILEFPKDVEVKLKYLFSYEIDTDLLFNNIISFFDQNENAFAKIIQLLKYTTIDQFPNLIDFFSVIYLFLKDKTKKDVKTMNDLIELYSTFSYVIPGLSQLYRKFEKIVLQFIDSFDSGITIDKMITIYNNSSEYLNMANLVKQGDTLSFIQKFTGFNLSLPMIQNFFDDHTTTMVMMIKKIANNVLNPREVQFDLVMEVRTVGNALFQFLFLGEKQCICKIRSPCVFLGNLYGDFTVDTLQKNLEDLKAKIAKTEEKLKMELDKEKKLAEDYAENTKNILDALKKFTQKKNLTKEELDEYIEKTKDIVDASLKTKQDYTKEFADIMDNKMEIDDEGDLYDFQTEETIVKSGVNYPETKKTPGRKKKLRKIGTEDKKSVSTEKDKIEKDNVATLSKKLPRQTEDVKSKSKQSSRQPSKEKPKIIGKNWDLVD